MPEWLPVAVTILMFLISLLLAIIGYFLKGLMQEHKELRQDHKTLRHDFETFKQQLPYLFVLREDWIRYSTAIEKKLDSIYAAVVELKVRNSAPTGGDD